MGVFQRRKTNEGGELAPQDTGAAGTDKTDSHGAAGTIKRKASSDESDGERKPAKKAAKKA